jgi:hypothetical protein
MPESENPIKTYMVFIEHTGIDDARTVRAVPLFYNTVTDTQNFITLSGRDRIICVLPE